MQKMHTHKIKKCHLDEPAYQWAGNEEKSVHKQVLHLYRSLTMFEMMAKISPDPTS